MSRTAEKIDKLLFTPPPQPTQQVGGGVRSQNWRDGWEGGTDGREGGRDAMAIMKLTQCIWHGMGA